MKSIFVFSDSHGHPLPPHIAAIAEESDLVFFLGDGAQSVGDLALHKNFYGVRGNCDSLPLPEELVVEEEGVKMLLTHGHKYGVKNDLLSLSLHAEELRCRLAFFGHTHLPVIEETPGLTLVNPGSSSCPAFGQRTYAYTCVLNGRAFTKIVPF